MIIQDEDDDNAGGDGAEAKMSPTNMANCNKVFNFNHSRVAQQNQ